MYFSYFELKKKKKTKRKQNSFLNFKLNDFFILLQHSLCLFLMFMFILCLFLTILEFIAHFCINCLRHYITIVQLKQHEQMKPMFYSIHKLNKSAISMNDFNPWIIFLLSLSGIKKPSPVLSLLWRPDINPEYCWEINFVHLNFQV